MPPSTPNRAFWRGVRDGTPFMVVLVPFAVLFGVIATEAGLNVFETLSFSVVVIAGAAQFAALQLISDQAPTLIVIVSALAVNLRMAMYSATPTPYLGQEPWWKRAIIAYFIVDQTFATSVAAYEAEPAMSQRAKTAYFFGAALAVAPLWWASTITGALIGKAIPDWLQLDFIMPIAFLAIIAPMLRTGAHVVAAFVAMVTALLMAFLPYNLGLMVAGIAGMMAGAEVERRMALREDRT